MKYLFAFWNPDTWTVRAGFFQPEKTGVIGVSAAVERVQEYFPAAQAILVGEVPDDYKIYRSGDDVTISAVDGELSRRWLESRRKWNQLTAAAKKKSLTGNCPQFIRRACMTTEGLYLEQEYETHVLRYEFEGGIRWSESARDLMRDEEKKILKAIERGMDACFISKREKHILDAIREEYEDDRDLEVLTGDEGPEEYQDWRQEMEDKEDD